MSHQVCGTGHAVLFSGWWVQEDLQAEAAAAAAAVQAELTASAEAGGTTISALGTCNALRAALVEHATTLQKWGVSMQLEGVRQGSAVRRLVEREKRLATLQEAEAALAGRSDAVQRAEAHLVELKVRHAC